MPSIKPITMPKWGLSMSEGILARWTVEDGAIVSLGQEIMDIETDKIANAFESPVSGVLRRVMGEGETAPVGALLAIVSEADASDAEIDRFVRECAAQPNTAERQCRCVVERLQETMPFDEFARADAALKENREPDAVSLEKLRSAVTACATS